MKVRALGTGKAHSRWPLIPPCWLIQTDKSFVLINCPPAAGARLELLGVDPEKIDMILLLGSAIAQIGGLEEFAYIAEQINKVPPYLVAPHRVLEKALTKIEEAKLFQAKAVLKVGLKEEHFTETITFLDNYSGSFGFRLEESKIFCSGSAAVNEDWIFQNMDCDLLLHEDRRELNELPVFMQNKIWIYGYDKPSEGNDPLPMLLMPQGSWLFDSDRRDKVMTKERFIRENSKRTLGHEIKK